MKFSLVKIYKFKQSFHWSFASDMNAMIVPKKVQPLALILALADLARNGKPH